MKSIHSLLAVLPLLVAPLFAIETGAPAPGKLNLLIITVDDMSADSVGAFGCPLAGTTPQIDRLAAQGMSFQRAHVVVANCMPSRNALLSGLYPHTSGVEGFDQVPGAKHKHLADVMQGAGYLTAIQGKVSHTTPYSPYPAWDLKLDHAPDGSKRDAHAPKSYRESMTQALEAARAAGKPLFALMNIIDPHKPFYGEGLKGMPSTEANKPTRVFSAAEVPVPKALFDDPVVRAETARYFSSVRRADDSVGEILAALDASGQRERTLVVFLSDHGMALPFIKTQLYHRSTHTPLIIQVPGLTTPGSQEREHMVASTAIMPTLLEMLDLPAPPGMQGSSFKPLLTGAPVAGHEHVIKEYNMNSGGALNPMRAVQNKQFLYIFNPWSDGKREMATATLGTPTYRRMHELAASHPEIAARHDMFRHRVPEELYDVGKDPDCLHNLIAAPEHHEELRGLTATLETWMTTTKDPLLPTFQQRADKATLNAFAAGLEARSKTKPKGAKGAKANKQADPDDD
jgi:N-sulfoglucosamine sulfohydrolase